MKHYNPFEHFSRKHLNYKIENLIVSSLKAKTLTVNSDIINKIKSIKKARMETDVT